MNTDAIISIKPMSKKQSNGPSTLLKYQSAHRPIRFATVLPAICYRPTTTSARFRNFWVTVMSGPPWFIRILLKVRPSKRPRAPLIFKILKLQSGSRQSGAFLIFESRGHKITSLFWKCCECYKFPASPKVCNLQKITNPVPSYWRNGIYGNHTNLPDGSWFTFKTISESYI